MKAIILAAGKGERMLPLTNHTPKPLLKVGNKSLLEWHLENFANNGFKTIVINNAWLGEKIVQTIGTEYLGMKIIHSSENEGLETAGGIAFALEFLDNEQDSPFAVVNGDTFIPNLPCSDFLLQAETFASTQKAFLYLVDNPTHNLHGDFNLVNDHNIYLKQGEEIERKDIQSLTFSGMALYRPSMFKQIIKGQHAKLSPLLNQYILEQKIFGKKFNDLWLDIGTPQRLEYVNNLISFK